MNAPEKRHPRLLPVATGPSPRLRTWVIGGGVLALVLGGYWYSNHMDANPGAQRNAAAPVRVALVQRRDMPVVERALGTVMASDVVEVTARVQGTLERETFKEGQFVKKGDLLFEIDPRPFQASLAQAEAI